MTNDDATSARTGTTLGDYERLQSLSDTRLQDIRRLTRLVCLLARADAGDAHRVSIASIGRILSRAEARASEDAALIMNALRLESLRD
ncbi:hypothetical protein [Paraburkholderia sp. J10-1]|uniref:hypothetical protein n=1 Tax=Paraburkholderia sp. J10-1 TaxID=2805430 RepID=UPI002AB71C09|nr:hypothetical protein [Paraburkholderia sp. J10-1]